MTPERCRAIPSRMYTATHPHGRDFCSPRRRETSVSRWLKVKNLRRFPSHSGRRGAERSTARPAARDSGAGARAGSRPGARQPPRRCPEEGPPRGWRASSPRFRFPVKASQARRRPARSPSRRGARRGPGHPLEGGLAMPIRRAPPAPPSVGLSPGVGLARWNQPFKLNCFCAA